MTGTSLLKVSCQSCSSIFEYMGYRYKPRKYCNDCLPAVKQKIRELAARSPQHITANKVNGLKKRGKPIRNRDSSHGAWKGDDVGIDALHSWVIRRLGKPAQCEHCGSSEKRTEWANRSQQYKRDVVDWIRLCRSCHLKYDIKTGARK